MIATDTATPAHRMPVTLLTVREVAFALGCGRTSVYALIAKGELPTVKVGRLTRIPVSAIAAFVARGVAGAGIHPPVQPAPRKREVDRTSVRTDEVAQGLLFNDSAPMVVQEGEASRSRRPATQAG